MRPGPQLRFDGDVAGPDHAVRLAHASRELRLHRHAVRKHQAARAVGNAVQHRAFVVVVHVVIHRGLGGRRWAGPRGDDDDDDVVVVVVVVIAVVVAAAVANDLAFLVEGSEEGFQNVGKRIVHFMRGTGKLDHSGVEIAAFSCEYI